MSKKVYLRKKFNTTISRIDQTTLLYILSIVVGILTALVAVILKNSIFYLSDFLTQETEQHSIRNIHYMIFPLCGIFLTTLFVKYVVRDNISHGISRVLYAISRRKSNIKRHNCWSSMIAGTITIGFGGSVGAEAPIVLTGSAIGSNIGKMFNLNYKQITMLVGCGAAGAVSAIFKAPIAGIVFTLEILMLDLTMSSIVPLMISSVTATTIAYFLMGEGVMFDGIDMRWQFVMANIPWYMVLGLFCGIVSIYFSKMTLFLEGLFAKIKNSYSRLIVGGALLGLLIFLFPPFCGEGYDTIRLLLVGDSSSVYANSFIEKIAGDGVVPLLIFMVGLILFKTFASSATNGAGGVGGIFAPTLFLGGICGFIVVELINIIPNTQIADGHFVLAGMAGLMAGVMHAPLTAIFLIAEITGGYSFFIPLIITSTVAYVTARSMVKYSIYHTQLAQRGELITHDKDKAVLTMMNWRKDIETDLMKIYPDDTLSDLVRAVSLTKRNIFPVVDAFNVFDGVVMLDDIREVMFNKELYDKIYVRDIMTIPPSYIDKSEPVESVMEAFQKTEAWNLPVLDQGRYVGYLSKARLYASYRDLLVQVSEE